MIKGLDSLNNKLKRMTENINKMSGSHSYGLDEIFSSSFMKEHTKSNTIDDFFKEGGFNIKNQKDFERLNEAKIDRYVKKNTSFTTRKDMLNTAAKKMLEEKIFN